MMWLTQIAVRRPVTTLMGCLMIFVLGWTSLTRLPVDLMPDIVYPTVSVTTIYEGAGPQEIETLITRPLEQAFSAVQGVDKMMSTSVEGLSTVRVQFTWGANIDSGISDMRARIEKLRITLPEGIEAPFIRRFDASDSPILYLGMNTTLDPVKATHFAEQTIVPRFEKIPGVAMVRVRGGTRREIQVNLNRTKLEALDMSIAEVVAVLKKENVNQPAGEFDEGVSKLLVRSDGEFRSLRQIEDAVVRERGGAVVRVRDIAEVVDGQEDRTEMTRLDGAPGIMLYIYRQSGQNTVDISDRVHKEVERLNDSLSNASLKIRIDRADYIRQSIASVKSAAISGMWLSILVLLVFLRSIFSTLVISIAMPLSILSTFILIYMKGYTLNMVSLGGLALGIGMLVDNSIVVLESIFLKREAGCDPVTAAILGTQEVAVAISASTLTTLIVFLPLMFIHGTTGLILHQMAWVVSGSLISSLLISLTVTPMLTVWWKLGNPAYFTAATRERSSIRQLERVHAFNKFLFGHWETAYGFALSGTIRYARLSMLLIFIGTAVTFGLIPRIGTEFLPKVDEGNLRIIAAMSPGIQFEKLHGQSRVIESRILNALDASELQTSVAFIGARPDDTNDPAEAMFRVSLVPRSQRDRSVDEVRKYLAEQVGAVGGMRVRVQASSDSMLTRMISGSGGRAAQAADLEIEVRGHDEQTGEQLVNQMVKKMQSIPGLVNITTGRRERRPEISARIDRSKASSLGVSVADITQTLETTIRGTEATVYRDQGDEYKVRVRLKETDRNRLTDIEHVGVTTTSGRIVPLKQLVTLNHSEAATAIHHLDQQRVQSISANVEDRDLGGVVGDIQEQIRTIDMPESFTINVGGKWEEKEESFKLLLQGFILAVILMYAVMAAQFESFINPLLVLISLPLGAVGVVLALLLTDTTLNVQSFIGIVMLAGIVVNNAIVLVDYIMHLRQTEPELSPTELVQKAGVRRLRPILMTTFTTVLGMLPIAMGWGEGGEMQAPLARVVIGGLISGTLITLFVLPIVCRWLLMSTEYLRPAAPNSPASEAPAL